MIILEGPDGAGKTTLLKELVFSFPRIPIAPRVVTKDAEAMVDLKKWVEENVSRGWQSTFFDRHRLISEPIYGPILRDRIEPGFDNVNWLAQCYDSFYLDIKPVIIYCLPPLQTVKANLEGDLDNTVVVDKIERIYSGYVTAAAKDLVRDYMNTFVYDYTNPHVSIYHMAHHIEKRLTGDV